MYTSTQLNRLEFMLIFTTQRNNVLDNFGSLGKQESKIHLEKYFYISPISGS
jgi:hypothetical protein